MKNFKLALIGVGGRGEGLYRVSLKQRNYVEIIAVCDSVEDRCQYISDELVRDGRMRPACYTDYKQCIDESKPDAIVVATDWRLHIEITMYAMERGVAVACEVGGSYSIQQLWELVRCYERTKTPVMMMENCCYGQLEMLALHMKRLGILGKIVHCDGGYRHDLREMFEGYVESGHYRALEYLHRNGDNYPTHDAGPIAKLLDINCGNRFVSLVSVASASFGPQEFIESMALKETPSGNWINLKEGRKERYEELKNKRFCQGDIITTIIKCANGETVTLTLDTTLPRYYSRDFSVYGTKGMIKEENRSVFIDEDMKGKEHWSWKENYNNVDEYYEKYNHPVWKDYKPGQEGHGGMDKLVFDGFFNALDKGEPMPIDVYDMATWMCITTLSEESISTGNAVAFPDFTDGKWVVRKNTFAIDKA